MSLINKMLKDLEKRGVKPSMAFGNISETTASAAYSAPPEQTQHETTADTETKKQPSRILIYGGLFLVIYLAAYGYTTLYGGNALKQMANPLQAQQYQPKAIAPIQTNTPYQATPAPSSAVAADIKAAIEAEIRKAQLTDDEAIEEMLSEAEATRQLAINEALEQDVAKEIKQVIRAKPEIAKSTPQKAVSKPKEAPIQVARIEVPTKPKPIKQVAAAAPTVKTSQTTAQTKAITADSNRVASTNTLNEVNAVSKPVKPKARVIAHEATYLPMPTQKPKIIKTVRSEQQAEALYQKALDYVQQGRVTEAQTVLANALDVNPAHQDARQTLAALLLDNQRIQAAKDVLQDGLVVTPNHLPFRMAVARLEVELGNPHLALDTLLAGKKQALNHADYQAFLGTLLQGQNRHAEAITHFQNALNINRGMSNVLIGMGVSYQALDRLDDAKLAYQKAQNNTRLPNDLKDFLNYRLKEVDQKISSK